MVRADQYLAYLGSLFISPLMLLLKHVLSVKDLTRVGV